MKEPSSPAGRTLSHENLTRLVDYAVFMLGRNRLDFHRGAFVERDQDEATFTDQWQVFRSWQKWLHESPTKPPQDDAEGER